MITIRPTFTGDQTAGARRWVFLGVLSMGLFIIAVDNSILFTALPTLRESLQTSDLQGLWIINAYPLTLVGLLLGTGTLGDKIGHRRMFLIGLYVFGIASLFAAFAPSAWSLVAARAALGVGAATMMPATLALISQTFTIERERNIAIGIWASTSTMGAALGPVVGGFLLEHFWWGSVFLVNVPIVVLVLILTYTLAPANQPNPQQHWDFASSLYAMFALVGFVMIIKELAHAHTHFGVLGIAAFFAVLGGILFQRRQRQLSTPVLEWSIFRNPLFLAGVIAASAATFLLVGVELASAQRFQIGVGFTPLEAGLLTTIVALAALPGSVAGGYVLHRIGFLPLISGGFTLLAIGLAVAAYGVWDVARTTRVLGPSVGGYTEAGHTNMTFFLLGLIVAGFGVGLSFSVASSAIIGAAPKDKAGMAASVEEVSYEFGTLLSVAILGSLFPLLYRLNITDAARNAAQQAGGQFAEDFTTDVTNPLTQPFALGLFDTAFFHLLVGITVLAAIAACYTGYLLRNNPKGTAHAH